MGIHSSSIISKEAEISSDAFIGPFCVIKGHVKIGAGTRLESHVSLGNDFGYIELGKDNQVSAGAVIGGPPQDLKYSGEKTELIIGDRNVFRECVTVNTGTPTGGGKTSIGDDNLLMAYAHIAHDCILKNRIIIANTCQFAGHVEVEDDVKVGGVCAINQFVRLGKHSYIAGDSAVNKDVLPFTIAQGKYAVMRATNKIGMDRAGISKEVIENVHRAIRFIIKGTDTIEQSLEKISNECESSDELNHLVAFLKSSERGIAK